MNEAQWAYIQAYVDRVKPLMLLADWRIDVVREQCNADSNATSDLWDCQNRSRVRFDIEEFPKLPAEEQRRIIAHELSHHHTIRLVNVVGDLRKVLGEAAWHPTAQAHDRADEIAVDQFARIIAPHLPPFELPPGEGGAESSS